MTIAPSLLAADFARLGEQVRELEKFGVEYLHVDVMDGHFVPNITIGLPVVAALRAITDLRLDVHLMIAAPERYLTDFAQAGADIITIHAETCCHAHRSLQSIRELGAKAGIALNPGTSLSALDALLPEIDLALVMSVNPGFGGQSYIPGATQRLVELKRRLQEVNPEALLEVDGGVNHKNIKAVSATGVDILVAGSAVFGGTGSIGANLQALRDACIDQ